jgi:N-methylhydantoinase A/oxoprolinase/acetone carboxylase beta subunit
LVSEQPEGARALDWLERHLDHFNVSTRPMDLLALNGRAPLERLTAEEERVVELRAERPHSVHELAYRACGDAWLPYPLGRLEDSFLIQRCGLTPTDVLHAMGQVRLWDADAARRICDLFARLMGMKPDAFLERVVQQVVQSLALELLKKQLDENLEGDRLEESPAAMALIRNLMNGGTDHYRVRVALRHPVIGIGAPVHHFLPQAAELLETAAVIPPHADVANAIGAITSSVCIRKQVTISPNEFGSYSLHGVPDTPSFRNFADAHQFAVSHLQKAVREMARVAGTSKTRVEILVDDSTAPVAYGGQIFLGRRLEARLSGPPDLARQTSHA